LLGWLRTWPQQAAICVICRAGSQEHDVKPIASGFLYNLVLRLKADKGDSKR
jgi:hypothetical protein